MSGRADSTPPCSVKPGRLTPAAFVEIVVHAHLDEVRRRHFGIEELVPLDEELTVFAGHAHGGMIVDDIVPAVMRDQPIDGGEVNACLPFCGRDVCLATVAILTCVFMDRTSALEGTSLASQAAAVQPRCRRRGGVSSLNAQRGARLFPARGEAAISGPGALVTGCEQLHSASSWCRSSRQPARHKRPNPTLPPSLTDR